MEYLKIAEAARLREMSERDRRDPMCAPAVIYPTF